MAWLRRDDRCRYPRGGQVKVIGVGEVTLGPVQFSTQRRDVALKIVELGFEVRRVWKD